jgi:hypothetical protein
MGSVGRKQTQYQLQSSVSQCRYTLSGVYFWCKVHSHLEIGSVLSLGDFLYADICISVFILPAVRSRTECENNWEYVTA